MVADRNEMNVGWCLIIELVCLFVSISDYTARTNVSTYSIWEIVYFPACFITITTRMNLIRWDEDIYLFCKCLVCCEEKDQFLRLHYCPKIRSSYSKQGAAIKSEIACLPLSNCRSCRNNLITTVTKTLWNWRLIGSGLGLLDPRL